VILARVLGNVVATRKHASHHGFKLMLVAPVDLAGKYDGEEFIATDAVGAGPGENVLVVAEGRSACDAMRSKDAPLDAAIVAIVDRIDLDSGYNATEAPPAT
jgi:ethanolamine utilization protein EutN